MPWRLILFILIFAVVLLFVVFNLKNISNISFGFTVIKDAPVFLTVFVSFFLGMVCALPIAFARRRVRGSQKKNKKEKAGKPDKGPDTLPENSEYNDRKSYGID